jgi:hypothetical protein
LQLPSNKQKHIKKENPHLISVRGRERGRN